MYIGACGVLNLRFLYFVYSVYWFSPWPVSVLNCNSKFKNVVVVIDAVLQ